MEVDTRTKPGRSNLHCEHPLHKSNGFSLCDHSNLLYGLTLKYRRKSKRGKNKKKLRWTNRIIRMEEKGSTTQQYL
jgi:hypothetical protein